MKINKLLTSYNLTPGRTDKIKYIVIHYVGATGGAKANCEYYAGEYVGASAHYYVGFDGEVWQSVEDHNTAWHCGTKGVYVHPECRNSNSIGIEMCVRFKGDPKKKYADSRDWYFEDETVKTAIELTKELMKKYDIDSKHVIRHYDVTGKICPNPYVYNHTNHTWTEFKVSLDASETTLPGWNKNNEGKYRYRKSNNKWAVNEWLLINHHWYLFGKDGYMLTGWQKWNGLSVVESNEMGEWYFLDNTPGGPLEGACWHSTEYGSLRIWDV